MNIGAIEFNTNGFCILNKSKIKSYNKGTGN